MIWNQPTTERERHRRAILYLCVSFALAALGYLQFGFDRAETLAYGILSFGLFHALNYRAMFGPLPRSEDEADRKG